MYYEVYIDSLLTLQFFMNLLLLYLVKSMMKHKVQGKRLFFGALGASLLSVVLLLLPLGTFFCMSLGPFLSAVIMGMVAFKVNSWRMFIKFMEKMSIGTLLLGGLSLLILKILPKGGDSYVGLTIVLMVAGVAFLIVKKWMQKRENNCCCVTLYGVEELEVKALVDTGNTLKEPISGKPVAVLDKKIFDALFPDKKDGFRVVPYRSVGKMHGIMPAYLLNRIEVKTEEGCMECHEVYVGISEDVLSGDDSYKMILNPKILQ